MYQGEGEDKKIVLIDFELFGEDPTREEKKQWQSAIFKEPKDPDGVTAQKLAAMSLATAGLASASGP